MAARPLDLANPPKTVTITELSVLSDLSVGGLQARIKSGKLSPPTREGYFTTKKALGEIKKHPKSNSGRKRKCEITPRPGRAVGSVHSSNDAGQNASTRRAAEHATTEPTERPEDDTESYDPDTRYRLAKARQEEIKLATLRGDTIDLRTAERRAFAFFRMVRDRLDTWVSRQAAVMAADLGVTEGAMWRRLKKGIRVLQEELAELDPKQALRQDVEEEKEDEDEDDT